MTKTAFIFGILLIMTLMTACSRIVEVSPIFKLGDRVLVRDDFFDGCTSVVVNYGYHYTVAETRTFGTYVYVHEPRYEITEVSCPRMKRPNIKLFLTQFQLRALK